MLLVQSEDVEECLYSTRGVRRGETASPGRASPAGSTPERVIAGSVRVAGRCSVQAPMIRGRSAQVVRDCSHDLPV